MPCGFSCRTQLNLLKSDGTSDWDLKIHSYTSADTQISDALTVDGDTAQTFLLVL